MKGIVFEYDFRRLAIGRIAGAFGAEGYLTRFGPVHLTELREPRIIADDWVIIRTRYCGICGSDTKQVFLDGNTDNPMTALVSFPQVLGHEVVGIIERIGPGVRNLKEGDLVVLNPWLSCRVRRLPLCKACEAGESTLCRNFMRGIIAPGIHTGNSRDATGGFAELVPAHESMAVPVPDGVTYDQAVLADPFSVAFHSILKVRPWAGSVCAVFGCGNLGLLTVHILKRIFHHVRVIAIARFPHQADMAKKFGADVVLKHSPASRIVEQVAEYLGCETYYADRQKRKNPFTIEGTNFLFDTVASGETLETGLRIVKARGAIVVTGVSSPKRFEWTPWYFKEIRVIGSNAFAVEDFEGHREHAYFHYFRFLREGRVDPSPMVTHKFPLEEYKDALVATRLQAKSRAIKVVLVHSSSNEKRGN